MRKAMRKKVGAGGRFDIFLDSAKILMLHCWGGEERARDADIRKCT